MTLRRLGERGLWWALMVGALGLYLIALPVSIAQLSRGFLGLSLSRDARDEIQLTVVPNSAAAQAGLVNGDILRAVNQFAVGPETTDAALAEQFHNPATSKYLLQVQRAGATYEATVARDTRLLDAIGWTGTTYAYYLVGWDTLLVLAFALLSGIIYWRMANEGFALLISVGLTLLAVRIPTEYFLLRTTFPVWKPATEIFLFCSLAIVPMVFALFPNGKFIPRWTRAFVGLGIVYAFFAVYVPNPFNRVLWPNRQNLIVDAVIIGLGVLAQILRYRQAALPEKQQTKWIVFGSTIAFTGFYFYAMPQSRFAVLSNPTIEQLQYQLLWQPLAYLAVLTVPLTITVSILRYRLWDIDIVIRRALVYVPLSAVLAALFTVLVSWMQRALIPALGWAQDVATVLTTLVIVAAFTPMRNAIQALVDARFKAGGQALARFRHFADQLNMRVAPVEEAQLARRLLAECLVTFEAKGGMVCFEHPRTSRRVFIAGEWTGHAVLSAPLFYQGARYGEITLAERKDETDYSVEEQEALEYVGNQVVRVIQEDAALVGPSVIDSSR